MTHTVHVITLFEKSRYSLHLHPIQLRSSSSMELVISISAWQLFQDSRIRNYSFGKGLENYYKQSYHTPTHKHTGCILFVNIHTQPHAVSICMQKHMDKRKCTHQQRRQGQPFLNHQCKHGIILAVHEMARHIFKAHTGGHELLH